MLVFCQSIGRSQETATITGRVVDPLNATVPRTTITVLNIDTQFIYKTITNDDGLFTVSGLPLGNYRIEAAKIGFKTVIKPDVVLHVQDVIAINFNMVIGSIAESVTVESGAPMINTTDGSLSTIVDRNFVGNMPLNGRSFQGLILLTPGVVTNSPQTTASFGAHGEFSVNGQRTESNYYTVDGVSANVRAFPGATVFAASAGSLPTSTVLGTTQGLVAVDALQEFRIQSSTYSAEYGRSPGGQFAFATRSGVNEWHGSAFDYIRNDVFDANNWFNDYYGLPLSPLRQNDFGGTLGGPVEIPHVYNGKDKTFFFFSNESLRLLQPREASTSYVPTSQLRTSAPSALQPVLNAFPVSNCSPSISNCVSDLGNGLGDFVAAWSNPSSIDSYSVRVDQSVARTSKLFFRFSDTSSTGTTRSGGNFSNPSNPSSLVYGKRTYTGGVTSVFAGRATNDFRLDYSSSDAAGQTGSDNFGNAKKTNLWQLQGFGPTTGSASVGVNLFLSGYYTALQQTVSSGKQTQWNLVDTFSLSFGHHQTKLGMDYRRILSEGHSPNPVVAYFYQSENSLQANSADSGSAASILPGYPAYTNFSAFAQDEWQATTRMSISLGVRWEINPAPGAGRGRLPYTVIGDSLGALELAPYGTSLWNTTWFNFAPRLGVAYVLRNNQAFGTVMRGGGGVFFDTGQQLGSFGYNGPGFRVNSTFCPRASCTFQTNPGFPLPVAQVTPAVVNPPIAPYTTVYAFPQHLQLPYTLEWNATVEQGLGKSQSLTISYVGAKGRRLLAESEIDASSFNPNFNTVFLFRNRLTSDYNALQIHFQRRLGGGLQALGSYTWSHSIDYGSFNDALPYVRGNSDLDVRHNFSAALSYDTPNHLNSRFARMFLQHWGVDDRLMARTAFPVTLLGGLVSDLANGEVYGGGLSVVPGIPIYMFGPQYPGGRSINANAFTFSPSPQDVAPRNFVRGFGAWQMDVAVRRDFPIYERLKLQFRADAFNVLNHPNFGAINSSFCSPGPGCTFGQATRTLAQSLGGLSSLYQMGGPRAMQFALRVEF
jgi:Carboxypeptidase regulatory-like domain/TonB dependent receptor